MNYIKFIPSILLLLILTPSITSAQTLSGEQFAAVQAFEFEYWTGEKTTIDDHKGKLILLDFWETWCVPCIASFPAYQRLTEEYPEQFVVLAATPEMMDDKARVDRFLSQNEYDFQFVRAGSLARDLRLTGIPFKVVIAPDGSLLMTDRGSGGEQREYQKFKKLLEDHF
ncbi:MAG: TlpA family protein disulfide reductase [Rhodothermaceae bacterium]|nr:TlpA family protein disulfide reductase [Rhodothermaceae bacterium]